MYISAPSGLFFSVGDGGKEVIQYDFLSEVGDMKLICDSVEVATFKVVDHIVVKELVRSVVL